MEASTISGSTHGHLEDGGGPAPGLGRGSHTGPDGRVRRAPDGGRVLVLNASYEPLNVCSVRRAVVLVLKDKAEVVERSELALRSESMTLPRPVVIRLVTYVRVPRDSS